MKYQKEFPLRPHLKYSPSGWICTIVSCVDTCAFASGTTGTDDSLTVSEFTCIFQKRCGVSGAWRGLPGAFAHLGLESTSTLEPLGARNGRSARNGCPCLPQCRRNARNACSHQVPPERSKWHFGLPLVPPECSKRTLWIAWCRHSVRGDRSDTVLCCRGSKIALDVAFKIAVRRISVRSHETLLQYTVLRPARAWK